MAQEKISQLPVATSIGSSDIIPIVQGGANKSTTIGALAAIDDVVNSITVTWDYSSGRTKKIAPINTNLTVSLTNWIVDQSKGVLFIQQDATGGRTLTLAGTLLSINSAANGWTEIGVCYVQNATGPFFIVSINPAPTIIAGNVVPVVNSKNTGSTTTIVLIFNEVVTATLAGWSFKKNGSTLTPSGISGSGTNTLTFTVPTMAGGDVLLCSYNSATGDCKDVSNNNLVSFTDQSVTNNIGLPQLNAPVLTAGTPTLTTIPLTWTDTNTSPNEASFLLETSANGTTGWSTVSSPAQNATSYTDSGIANGTTKYYRITAIGDGTTATSSVPSNVVSGTTLASGLALDGITGISGWGLNKLRTAYAGFAALVRRSSDSTTQNIGFVGNDFDITSFNTFVGGGTGVVVTLYDQGTPGNDLSAPLTSACPQIIASGINGKPTMLGSVSELRTSGNYYAAAAQRSLFAVYKNLNTGTFVGSIAGQTGSSNGAGSWFEIEARTNTTVGDPYLNTFSGSITDSTSPISAPARLATALYDGTSTFLRRGGSQIATGTISLNTDQVVFRIFNDGLNNYHIGWISAIISHVSTCMSGSNLSQIENSLKTYYSV